MLSGLGAALGLVFAQWFSRLLVRQLSTATNNVYLDLTLDWRVLGVHGGRRHRHCRCSSAPCRRCAPRACNPNDAIKEQGRGVAGHGRFALGNLLVVAQVALSLVLVVGAGLFVRTFIVAGDAAPRLRSRARPRRRRQRAAAAARARRAAGPLPRGCGRGRRRCRVSQRAALSVVTPISGSTWSTGSSSSTASRSRSPTKASTSTSSARLVHDLRHAPARRPRFHVSGQARRGHRRDRQRGVRAASSPAARTRSAAACASPRDRAPRIPSARSSATSPTPRIARCATRCRRRCTCRSRRTERRRRRSSISVRAARARRCC